MEEELLSKEELIKDIETQQITSDDLEDIDEEIYLDLRDRKLFIEKSDPPIRSLYEQYQDGELILQPKFQRKYVMKKKHCK